MLKNFIEIFCSLKDGNKEKIQKALDSENWNNYTIFLHALKSTSLSIGGEQTSNLAKKLEAEGDILRDNDSSESDKQKAEAYIKIHHDEAMELYDKLVEEGRRYLNEGKNAESFNSIDIQEETFEDDDDDESDLELMLRSQEALKMKIGLNTMNFSKKSIMTLMKRWRISLNNSTLSAKKLSLTPFQTMKENQR